MIVLAVLTGVLLAVAAIFMVRMFRRDDSFLGLMALTVTLLAAIPAVLYTGLDSQ